MDLEQLLQFRAAARLNHMGRAAEELQVSQPALSQTIKRLEKRYGVRLFDRIGRTVRLNAGGRVLLEHVERALLALEDADKAMRDLRAGQQQSIALGYFGGRNPKAIPYLTREFQRNGMAVDFGLVRGPSVQLFSGLKDGTLDFCFTTLTSTDDDITGQPLWYENLYVLVPANHRLAGRSLIDLAEIADEPMLSLRKGSDLRTITDGLCEAAGFTPNIVFEGQNNVTLHGLVAANVGVALAPELETPEQDVVALVVRAPVCVRPIYMSWMRGRYLSTAAKAFRDFVLSSRAKLQAVGLEPIP
jgi:DNA-binding transcriptional LysR family regulator